MYQPVEEEVGVLTEALSTVGALKGFLSHVESLMDLQGCPGDKLLPAVCTVVRFIPHMNPLMPDQMGVVLKTFPTVTTLKGTLFCAATFMQVLQEALLHRVFFIHHKTFLLLCWDCGSLFSAVLQKADFHWF